MKWIKLFIYSAGGILLAAALGRFAIAAGSDQVLSLPEPMLGIPLRFAVLIIGGVELAVALICLFGRRAGIQLGWLTWLASTFILYRIGLSLSHLHPQSTSVGSITDPFHLTYGMIGTITSFVPFYLVAGSCAAGIWSIFAKKVRVTPLTEPEMPKANPLARSPVVLARFLKIPCTACGGHIEFPTNTFGEKIACPHCHAIITLQKPKSLKMACSRCDGHIEFPDYAVGQTIPCPHCKMEIILKEPA